MRSGKARPRVTLTQRHTAIVAATLVGLALSVASCAATARPTPEWVKTRESAADFDTAREACKQQALAEVSGEYRDPIATQAGAGSFFKCMASRGWKQEAKAPTPAAP